MHRFVIEHNIDRYEAALATCDDESERSILMTLLDEARQALAELDAHAAETAGPQPKAAPEQGDE